jgi:hypothetical protein
VALAQHGAAPGFDHHLAAGESRALGCEQRGLRYRLRLRKTASHCIPNQMHNLLLYEPYD